MKKSITVTAIIMAAIITLGVVTPVKAAESPYWWDPAIYTCVNEGAYGERYVPGFLDMDLIAGRVKPAEAYDFVVKHCNADCGYQLSPLGVMVYIDNTGGLSDRITDLKKAGVLPEWYVYHPLKQFKKISRQKMIDLWDQGVDMSPVFDADWYSANIHPNIHIQDGAERYFKEYFVARDMYRGLPGSPEFDVMTYMASNPDLYAVYGTDVTAYYIHYLTLGKDEGRKCK